MATGQIASGYQSIQGESPKCDGKIGATNGLDLNKIPDALMRLTQIIASTNDYVDKLNNRLEPIMSPKPSNEQIAEARKEPIQDPIKYTLTHINMLSESVIEINRRISSIISEIDY